MAVSDEYKRLALKDVDILSVIKYIENEYSVDFNVQEGSTINLRCPYEVYDVSSSVHETSSIEKTSINLEENLIKCWNPSCTSNRGTDTIGLIRLFDEHCSFEDAVKTVLDIGGFEYESDEKELSEEARISMLMTGYVRERSDQLMRGYEIIEECREPVGRDETLYFDAAKYLVGRGISKFVARKMRMGIGGGQSKVLKNSSMDMLKKAKIYNSKGNFELMNKRIIIPNIAKGFVVGMTGRAIYDDNRRYINVGAVKNLINIDIAKKYDVIYLFEGALNRAAYEELTGCDNVMAMQGAETFKKEFLEEIIKIKASFNKNVEFIYVSDCDTAGLKAALNVGIEMLRLGFSLNVLVTPQTKKGKKIDANDILMRYGKENGRKVWDNFVRTAEPFIVFAIKQEIASLKGLNTLTLELRKCKVIQKYLSMDFIDPNERWVLEQYFLSHGYPTTTEFFKYADIKFVNEPLLSGDKLICFVGEMDETLKSNLDKNNKQYNIIDVDARVNIYDIDKSVNVILITNNMFLLKTKKIYEKLIEKELSVKIFYTEKPIKSLIEYVFAISKAIDGKEFFDSLNR